VYSEPRELDNARIPKKKTKKTRDCNTSGGHTETSAVFFVFVKFNYIESRDRVEYITR